MSHSFLGDFATESEYRKVWKNQPHIKLRHRDGYLRARYGITAAQYDEMLTTQNGRCRICGTVKVVGKQKYFHVDHDPETGHVRGLLCQSCNTGIGHFGHVPELLREAANYLEGNEEFSNER